MHVCLGQALAVLEWRAGDYERAHELFTDATRTCGPHAPLLGAWALMEVPHPGYFPLIPCTPSYSTLQHKLYSTGRPPGVRRSGAPGVRLLGAWALMEVLFTLESSSTPLHALLPCSANSTALEDRHGVPGALAQRAACSPDSFLRWR